MPFGQKVGQKVIQFYYRVIGNESRESFAEKKLHHNPIARYLRTGKTVAPNRDLDTTDQMAELDGVLLSSVDVDIDTKIWLGEKWFTSFLAVWVVQELPSGTPLMEIEKRHRKALEEDISYSDLSLLLDQKTLFDGQIYDSRKSFFHYIGAVSHHGPEGKVTELETVLSNFLQNRKHPKTLMEDFNADQQGSSEESLSDAKSQHRTCATVPTDAESPCIMPVPWENHKGFTSNGIDVDQNTASTREEEEGRCTTMITIITETDWRYTLALKEKADQESVIPRYEEAGGREYPPLWVVTVAYNNITEAGQAKSKREAKHLASKKAWYRLGGREL